jgi:thiamine biosynthesis lipoprotein ApbE
MERDVNPMIVEHPFHDKYVAKSVLMTTNIEIVASYVRGLAGKGMVYMSALVDRINRFNPTSELSGLNNGAKNEWRSVSKLMYDLLEKSSRLKAKTNGLFSIEFEGVSKLPNGAHGYELNNENGQYSVKLNKDTFLNFGGIGKGFIVDKVYDFLNERGAKNILVNAGGDLRARSIEAPWKVGIMNPYQKGHCFACLKIRNSAVVSSGITARNVMKKGEKYTHFFNANSKQYMVKTPYSQVTVQGDLAAEAEVYAKCLLMGSNLTLSYGFKGLGVRENTRKVCRL